MKNELKTLYRKNPKLALQVAKALGLKIRVKATFGEDLKKVVDAFTGAVDNMTTARDVSIDLFEAGEQKQNADDVDRALTKMLVELRRVQKSVVIDLQKL